MKDKTLERRIKIGVTMLILFVAIISTGISTLVITDNRITFQNVIEVLDNTTSIQDAIDSITDATETNPYQILVYPGYYYENIVLKDWVSITGTSTTGDVVITANTGTLITWDGTGCTTGNNSHIGNIGLISTPTTTGVQLINATAGTHEIFNCFFYAFPTGVSMISMNVNNSSMLIRSSVLDYTSVGNATGIQNHIMIQVRRNSSLKIYDTESTIELYDCDDTTTMINFNSTDDENFILLANIMHIRTRNTTFNGTAQMIVLGQNNTNDVIQGNYFHIEGSSGNGTAYCYNLTDIRNAEIHSTSNRIIIDGYAFSYFAVIDASNTVISHFDDIIALEEVLGDGNTTVVNSRSDGELFVEVIDVGDSINGDMFITDLVTGSIDMFFDIVINTTGSFGGEYHVIDVALSGNETLVNITAISTYDGVDVIHQHIGVDVALDRGMLYDGVTYTNVTDSFNNTTSDVTMFSSDNDYIYIGSQALFDNIIVTLDTPGSASIFQPGQDVFEYSTGAGGWQSFSPGDDTNGFTQSGFIRFGRNSLSGWATNNPHFGALYYIRIQRTRNNLLTSPVESTIHIESTAGGDYEWNSDGNISCNNLQQKVASGDLTDGTPTTAEITNILEFGPDDVGAGWKTYILDTTGTVHMYQIVSDGTAEWYYVEMADAD